mmetsp:Transcript_23379/g.32757  ORF Transcript_23379/g.32757 Transcript_23379/m.32757 type:complete len:164 (-) Transcript_23379:88-579(-)
MQDIYDWYHQSSIYMCPGSMAYKADGDYNVEEDWICHQCSYTNVDAQNPICSVCGHNSSSSDKNITISINYTGCARDYPAIKLTTSLSNDDFSECHHQTRKREFRQKFPITSALQPKTAAQRQSVFAKTRDNMIDHDLDDRPPEMTTRRLSSSSANTDRRKSL